jgi:hypothetical protein
MMELEDPIGKIIKHGEEEEQIIGVVKDFQYGSIHQQVEPLIFRFRSARVGRNIMVKIKTDTERATIEQIEKLYKEFHPKYPFEFSFLDDNYQALYEAENRVAALSKYFTIIAIIISCLGLFGLATFTTERRLKEIGIRKILGSTEFGIVYLLSSDVECVPDARVADSGVLATSLPPAADGRSRYRAGAGSARLSVAITATAPDSADRWRPARRRRRCGCRDGACGLDLDRREPGLRIDRSRSGDTGDRRGWLAGRCARALCRRHRGGLRSTINRRVSEEAVRSFECQSPTSVGLERPSASATRRRRQCAMEGLGGRSARLPEF